jgi:hypothetical protein
MGKGKPKSGEATEIEENEIEAVPEVEPVVEEKPQTVDDLDAMWSDDDDKKKKKKNKKGKLLIFRQGIFSNDFLTNVLLKFQADCVFLKMKFLKF